MNNKKIILVSLVLAGIGIAGVAFTKDMVYQIGFWLIALIPLVFYFWQIYSEEKPKISKFDNVYYFGFLLTIAILALTSLHINELKSEDYKSVIPQFSLGLLTTALALLGRIILIIVKSPPQDETEQLKSAIGGLAKTFDDWNKNGAGFAAADTQNRYAAMEAQFNQASSKFDAELTTSASKIKDLTDRLGGAEKAIEAFVMATYARCQNMEQRLNDANVQFSTKVLQTADTMAGLLSDTTGNLAHKLNEAAQLVDDFVLKTQTRCQAMEQQLAAATVSFDQEVAAIIQTSLENNAAMVHAASADFSAAITLVTNEIARLRQEAANVSFKTAAKRLDEFSKTLEDSFSTINAAVANNSEQAASAIDKLTATADGTRQLAEEIAARLQSLRNLETLVAHINKASLGLAGISSVSADANTALSSLTRATHTAIAELDSGIIQPLAGSPLAGNLHNSAQALEKMRDSSGQAAGAIDKLTATANDTRQLAEAVATHLQHLQNLETLVAHIDKANLGLADMSSVSAEANTALSSLTRATHTAIAELDNGLIQPLAGSPLAGNLRNSSHALEKMQDSVARLENSVTAFASPVLEFAPKLAGHIESSSASVSSMVEVSTRLRASMESLDKGVQSTQKMMVTTLGVLSSLEDKHAVGTGFINGIEQAGQQFNRLTQKVEDTVAMMSGHERSLEQAFAAAISAINSIAALQQKITTVDEVVEKITSEKQRQESLEEVKRPINVSVRSKIKKFLLTKIF